MLSRSDRIQGAALAIVSVVFGVPLTVFILITGYSLVFGTGTHVSDRKLDAIKDCNRLGGIYTEGICQHPFAPICNRVGNTGTAPAVLSSGTGYFKRE